ncbi:MAG: hypothetical protein COB32_09910 [Halomonas sp.]|nr:hypothetical protein [Halomonas sp.]PHR01765.1 MAG: hypothetical protein COB32_09910 [Halomonas sp.]
MGTHSVVAFVNDKNRTFTTTARMEKGSHLNGVIKQSEDDGYRTIVVAAGLEKTVANALKDAINHAYAGAGYGYEPREAL